MPRGPQLAARIAVIATIGHAATLLALHVLEPELGISRSLISDYGATDSAWLATTAFFVFGAVWAALSFALSAAEPSSKSLLVARGLFLLVGSTLWLISGAGIVLLIATIGFLIEAGYGGYGQRAIFVLVYAWVLIAARPIAVRVAEELT